MVEKALREDFIFWDYIIYMFDMFTYSHLGSFQ